MKFDIRLKLEDVLRDEEIILPILYRLKSGKIKLWYDSDIPQGLLDSFSKKWNFVEITKDTPGDVYVWFDIINKNDISRYRTKNRFYCCYSTNDELLIGLFTYHSYVNKLMKNNKKIYKNRHK